MISDMFGASVPNFVISALLACSLVCISQTLSVEIRNSGLRSALLLSDEPYEQWAQTVESTSAVERASREAAPESQPGDAE